MARFLGLNNFDIVATPPAFLSLALVLVFVCEAKLDLKTFDSALRTFTRLGTALTPFGDASNNGRTIRISPATPSQCLSPYRRCHPLPLFPVSLLFRQSRSTNVKHFTARDGAGVEAGEIELGMD